jgi:hypothetical protein
LEIKSIRVFKLDKNFDAFWWKNKGKKEVNKYDALILKNSKKEFRGGAFKVCESLQKLRK